MNDRAFNLVVLAGGAALVAAIAALRFCGDLTVAPVPPPPTLAQTSTREALAESSESAEAFRALVEKDAATAGVTAPTPEELARVLPYRVDTQPRTLAPGQPPIDAAGIAVHAEIATADGESDLILVVENHGDRDLAYRVVTRPSVPPAACQARQILFYDANVVAAHGNVRRSECVYRDDTTLEVSRIETVELPPLASYYVSRLPAAMLTLDARLTVGHKPLGRAVPCKVMMSQAIRSGVENGEIGWRDLVDFYARHRCDTYQFPEEYKAFTKDGERSLPAVGEVR